MTSEHRAKRITIISLSWALTALCMCAIFYFSHQNSEESAEVSMETMNFFLEFLFSFIDHNIFRKLAHFTEYCALAFLCFNATYQSRKKLTPYIPFAISFLYAVSDEIHQHFVPGRACRIFDIGVDTSGILLGLLAFFLLAKICFALSKKLKQKTSAKRSEK